MDYTVYETTMRQLLNMTDSGGAALVTSLLPRVIEYAELRIYRKFDFLASRSSDITQSTTPGFRDVPIPAAFVVIEGASLITPANAKPTDSGAQRIPMLRTQRAFIDMIWPIETATAAPGPLNDIYFSVFNMQTPSTTLDTSEAPQTFPQASIQIAPTPDAAYLVEFTGTMQPTPLSDSNTTTFLSTYYPDLFIAASMVFASGALLRNYGEQSDDPRQAVSWEGIYQGLLNDIDIEEMRRKSMSVGQSAYAPTEYAGVPIVAPPAPKVAP